MVMDLVGLGGVGALFIAWNKGPSAQGTPGV